MAIITALPGLRVTVECDRRTLTEYPDEDEFKHKKFRAEEDRVVSKYIECVTDAEFQVKCEILPGFQPAYYATHTTFWVDIDNKPSGGYHNRTLYPTFSATLTEALARTVDDADFARVRSDMKLVEGLGEIIVHVHQTIESPFKDDYRPKANIDGSVTEVSEKALKGQAISHGVSFGPERRTYHPVDLKRTYPEGYNKPLAIFRFKYRSREALQQELIIPRSPSPDMVMLNLRDSNKGANRLSNRERLAQLKREMEQIKSEVKEEEQEGGNGNRRGHKRSSNDAEIITSGRAYKTSRGSNGSVVVDLTDDD
ncbi:hypothetical protein G7Y89_g14876 [Cudoniella acicularis]|uniref:DUF7918 domain-containing protein n=1 Tax=Cudoniella acicularis TaxID=354080 RepID=A0A8H4VQB8_9HELO|nr:hypothetical protein G7Y89_g14876 [Cudoniella acicularis]